jgi:hypothetical protein
LDPTEWVLPEDGDRIQSPKRCVLKHKQDEILDKDETMDNVQKHNFCTNIYLFIWLEASEYVAALGIFCGVWSEKPEHKVISANISQVERGPAGRRGC